MGSLTKKAAIVGVAESDIGLTPGKSPLELMAQAAKRALDDAGLKKEDIDGFCFAAFGGNILDVGEYLQIMPKWCDSTQFGGSSFDAHVGHAAAAIAAGLCETVLVVMGTTNESDQKIPNMPRGGGQAGDARGGAGFSGRLYGLGGPVNSYSMAATRHMHLYGTTMEDLANVAINTREWAILNPKAKMGERGHLTVQDVLNSPMISYPLHLLDCCLTTDAGGAVIVTTPERARNLKKKPVWILGYGEHFTHNSLVYVPDITVTPAVQSGNDAFKMAGLTRKDVDFVQTYDSFTITTLLALEDLGFCKKGEGGAFFANKRTAPGGAGLPVNTSGGGLSYTHPGMFGIFLLIEAVRQLRGECGARQVKGAEVGIANGMGGLLSSAATVILGKD